MRNLGEEEINVRVKLTLRRIEPLSPSCKGQKEVRWKNKKEEEDKKEEEEEEGAAWGASGYRRQYSLSPAKTLYAV